MTLLAGRIALVTGGSRGIGAAIARELAACGARVLVNFRDGEKAAATLCEELHTLGCHAESIRCDVSDRAEVHRAIADIESAHGAIDILVNNAGILRDRSFSKMSVDEWSDVLNVNLQGTINTCSAAIKGMLAKRYGRIINISSFVAQAGNFGQTNYATAKAGMIGFTRSLALEVARDGVTVNAICPGFIDTEMWTSIPEAVQRRILDKIPLQRVGQPAEVAKLVRFLAAEGDYITGQTLNINGGYFIG